MCEMCRSKGDSPIIIIMCLMSGGRCCCEREQDRVTGAERRGGGRRQEVERPLPEDRQPVVLRQPSRAHAWTPEQHDGRP